MINSINIQNFQSHKETYLSFHDGLNVIVGATDSGKSSIIKSLFWLVCNRPVGDSYRSFFGGDTEITLQLSEGEEIVRRKTDSESLYKLGDNVFRAFGTKVPEEVQSALRLADLSLQTQFQPHFLLSMSSGEVAQHFNRVSQIEKIDLGLTNTNSWARQTKQKLESVEELVKRYEEELEQYSNLEDLEEELEIIEELEKEYESSLFAADGMLDLHGEIVQVEYGLSHLDYLDDMQKEVAEIIELCEAWDEKIYQLQVLERAINYMKKMDKIVGEIDQELSELEEEFHECVGEVCILCGQKIEI